MFRAEVESSIMTHQNEPRYSIEELADKGGVTRRTVRYYVQRGLLPAPNGTGRGPHYTDQHLDTLIRIRELQEHGVGLADIPARLGHVPLPPGPEPPVRLPPQPGPWPQPPYVPYPVEPSQSLWTRIVLEDGVELHVRNRPEGLPLSRLAALAEAVRRILGPRP